MKRRSVPPDSKPRDLSRLLSRPVLRLRRLCKHCGISFVPKRKDQIYCKEDCRLAHYEVKYAPPDKTLMCARCGVNFTTTCLVKQKYCSVKCRRAAAEERYKDMMLDIISLEGEILSTVTLPVGKECEVYLDKPTIAIVASVRMRKRKEEESGVLRSTT